MVFLTLNQTYSKLYCWIVLAGSEIEEVVVAGYVGYYTVVANSYRCSRQSCGCYNLTALVLLALNGLHDLCLPVHYLKLYLLDRDHHRPSWGIPYERWEDMVSGHLEQGNMDLCLDHAFAYSVAFLQVAWDKCHTEVHLADQLFVVDLQQTVHILGLVEAFPCLLGSKRLEEHYTAKEFAVAALVPENEQLGLIVAAESESVASAAHLLALASAMRHPLVVAVQNHRHWHWHCSDHYQVLVWWHSHCLEQMV